MNAIDFQKGRRETLRWYLLLTLHAGSYIGCGEPIILSTLSSIVVGVTQVEIRRELDYLAHRDLVEITGQDTPCWVAKLTRVGTDLVEYTVPCEPGIARPAKYWGE